MRFFVLLTIALTGLFFTLNKDKSHYKNEINNRPNVVYINVDDLGWKDLGIMDDGYFESPHIDQLSMSIFPNFQRNIRY